MPITAHTLALAAQTKAHTTAQVDAYTYSVIRSWANAWDDLARQFDIELRAIMKLDKWADGMDTERIRQIERSLSGLVDRRLAELINETGAQVGSVARQIANATVAGMSEIIASQLPPSHHPDFLRPVPQPALDWVAHRTTQQVTVRNYFLAQDATRAMKRELMLGTAAGDNPRDAAKRMISRVEGEFNGGLTRATVIARTEMLDAARDAALEQRKANADIINGWIWQASLTERTCPSCWAMHGTRHPVDEPGPIDHHQGRCTSLPETKTWKSLGFNIKEPEGLYPSADEARSKFESLSEAKQREILGVARYDAYKAGAYPMEKWPQRREHWETVDGVTRKAWRDSIHTSPAPHPPVGGWAPSPAAPPTLTTGLLNDDARQTVEHVVDQMRGLHALPDLTFDRITAAELRRSPGLGGYYTHGKGIRITEGSPLIHNATAHETGHLLDRECFGAKFYASDARTTEAWKAWYRSVRASDTFKVLAGRSDEWARYARTPRELWARSYAQWVAKRSGSTQMAAEMATMRERASTARMLWGDEEFESIAKAIDAVIKELKP